MVPPGLKLPGRLRALRAQNGGAHNGLLERLGEPDYLRLLERVRAHHAQLHVLVLRVPQGQSQPDRGRRGRRRRHHSQRYHVSIRSRAWQ